jgi:excisionase family DNA binding protein
VQTFNGHALLSPRDAARALGASESSLKRWVDAGELVAQRTGGGHRRIPVSEVLRFAGAQGIALRHPELVGGSRPAVPRDLASRLVEGLLAGNAAGVQGLLLDAYLGGLDVPTLGDGPLLQALAVIGGRWQNDPAGIAEEHRATLIIVSGLAALRSTLPKPAKDAPVAVGGAPERDPYLLGSALVAMAMQEAGWLAIDLGPDTPDEALNAAARRHHASLVWRACTGEPVAGAVSSLKSLCRRLAPLPVAIGGRCAAAYAAAGCANLSVHDSLAALVQAHPPRQQET